MGNKSKIEIMLSAKDTGLTAALTRAKAQVSAFSAAISSASAPFRSLISSALSLKTTLAGLVAGAGVTTLSASLIKAGQSMDSLRLSYQAIAGSSAGAAREMEFVRATADQLGLDLMTTAQAYKQLAAASMGTSLAGKQTRDIFVAVAKASTTLGLSADETSGALQAISQMISKGKVSAEELRGQLGERLPGAFQIAAQAMGMTTVELDKFMSDGRLMADDFLPRFARALEQRFGLSAAKAADGFTAASNRIASALDTLKGGLGQAVTNNQFFVAALDKVGSGLKSLSTDVAGNGTRWREWAKQSALSVMGFVADSADGFNAVYKSLSVVSGTLKLAAAGAMTLGKGFQYLFEQANRLVGDSDKATYWAQAQVDATALIEQAMAGAAKSFDSAERGSTVLEQAAAKVRTLQDELSKVESTEVIPAEDVQKTTEQIVKIGDTWFNVTREVKATNAETTKEVDIDWGRVWTDFERNGLTAAEAVDSALDRATRAREAVIKVKQVDGRSLGGLIGAYQSGGMISAIQALAAGGRVRNILSGGRLSGYGGGDRRLLLGEDGEFMIRKEAVRRFGAHVFHALNNLQLPRFALGGQLGGTVSAAGGETMNINLTFPGGGSVPVMATPAMARELLRQFERMGWRASA